MEKEYSIWYGTMVLSRDGFSLIEAINYYKNNKDSLIYLYGIKEFRIKDPYYYW